MQKQEDYLRNSGSMIDQQQQLICSADSIRLSALSSQMLQDLVVAESQQVNQEITSQKLKNEPSIAESQPALEVIEDRDSDRLELESEDLLSGQENDGGIQIDLEDLKDCMDEDEEEMDKVDYTSSMIVDLLEESKDDITITDR